jgi:hypothetical protein
MKDLFAHLLAQEGFSSLRSLTTRAFARLRPAGPVFVLAGIMALGASVKAGAETYYGAPYRANYAYGPNPPFQPWGRLLRIGGLNIKETGTGRSPGAVTDSPLLPMDAPGDGLRTMNCKAPVGEAGVFMGQPTPTIPTRTMANRKCAAGIRLIRR